MCYIKLNLDNNFIKIEFTKNWTFQSEFRNIHTRLSAPHKPDDQLIYSCYFYDYNILNGKFVFI